MKKKLVLRVVKFEKALAMQVLEQEGLPEYKPIGFVGISSIPSLDESVIWLRGANKGMDFNISVRRFDSNKERDIYFNRCIKSITEELFTMQGELKVGERCEVKDDDAKCWNESRLLAILPETCKHRYITYCGTSAFSWAAWDSVRPIIKKVEPKIDGEVYTWVE